MEGALSSATVCGNMGRGKRAAGDLLPWTVSQQFMVDSSFLRVNEYKDRYVFLLRFAIVQKLSNCV